MTGRSPSPRASRPLYTIGHSTRSIEEFCEILLRYQVRCLVDIRRFPRSRSHPQFNGDALTDSLREHQVEYAYFAALGGRRNKDTRSDPRVNAGWQVAAFHNYADYAETTEFRESLDALRALATEQTCAIMCAEAVWWRCHRRIVADHLLAHDVAVIHLFTANKAEPAQLTPFAQVTPQGRVHYPAP